MPPSILKQGQTAIRDAVRTLVTHVCFSDDTTVFDDDDTGINPGAGATSTIVKAVTETVVDYQTIDYSIVIDGTTEFTGKVINCGGIAKGLGIRSATGAGGTHTGGGIVGTDCLTRSKRDTGLGIGVQAGDLHTVAIRVKHEDNS